MKHSPHRILLFSLLLGGWGLGSVAAQRAEKEVPTFELAVAALGWEEVPSLFWQGEEVDESGKARPVFEPLPVGNGRFGPAVKIPFRPGVEIFQGSAEEGAEGKMKPFARVPVRQAGEAVQLVLHLDAEGRPAMQFLSDAGEDHGPGTVRVVNLSGQRLAYSVGGPPVPVADRQDHVSEPVIGDNGRFEFRYFHERPERQPYESPTRLLRFRDANTRLLVVFAPLPEKATTGEGENRKEEILGYRLVGVRMYQRVAGEAAPRGTGAATVRTQPVSSRSTTVAAANTPATSSTLLPARELIAVALGGGSSLPDGLEVESGDTVKTLSLAPGEFASVTVSGSGPARVRLPGAGNRDLAEVGFSATGGSRLLVLAPGDSPGEKVRAATFDDSPQSHPPGQFRLFNLTPYQLAVQADGKLQYIDPKESGLAGVSGKTLKIAAKAGEGWKLVSDQTEEALLPGLRGYVFVGMEPQKEEFLVVRRTR